MKKPSSKMTFCRARAWRVAPNFRGLLDAFKVARQGANIVGSHYNHGKACVGEGDELLDNRPSLIRLVLED
jgi:hypothetical protein